MRNFDIFVDSSANIPDDMLEKYGIQVVSYTCTVDGKDMECYEKGVPFAETAKKFYAAMREGADTKTTLVNSEKIISAVTPSFERGRDVLFITISSNISGTYNQAIQAANSLRDRFPERKMLVADSYNASMGEGLFALYAAIRAEEGDSLESIHEWICNSKLNMHGIFTVANLKYLRRGGRISSATAIAGTILNIKPVLWGSEKGVLAVLCNERGRKKALSKLADLFKENVIEPENQIIAITHADCEEEANELAEKLKEYGAREIVMNIYDICTGSHVGPGTVALFFLGKERGAKDKQTSHLFPAFRRKQPTK